jgi:23S rRNA pseudouridine1911/1915/1917 synthase
METKLFTVPAEQAGERVDRYLSELLDGFARSSIQRLCEEGLVLAAGRPVRKITACAGGLPRGSLPAPRKLEVAAQDIPLSIVYEDVDLLVVNKPKGLVVHPAPGNEDGTLVNALLWHCGESLSGINGVMRPGIVHRIDKDTSGLLVVAKNDLAHRGLAGQIARHSFTRRYEAAVYGAVKEGGTVNAPIARHPVERKRMCSMQGGREAVTHYEVIGPLDGFTHLGLQLETGRTHQIRVHMALIGHPVAGDPVYGPKKIIGWLDGQCLHARTLGFLHPASGEYMEFTTELPDYFKAFLQKHGVKD